MSTFILEKVLKEWNSDLSSIEVDILLDNIIFLKSSTHKMFYDEF